MKQLFKRTLDILNVGEYRWIPSSLSFHFFLSFVPIVFILIMLSVKQITNSGDMFVILYDNPILQEQITTIAINIRENFEGVSLTTLIILVGYSLYLSSNGVVGIIHAIGSFYGFERKNFIIVKTVAFVTNLVILITFMAISLLSSLIPTLLTYLNVDFSFSYYFAYFSILPVLYIVIHIIYLLVSMGKLKSKDIYKGAIFTTIAIYSVLIFTTYFMRGSTSDIIYGSLASIIFIAYFIYYICFVIYLGISINVADYQLNKEKMELVTNEK